MCPKFCTNSVVKLNKCHISILFSNFLKLCLPYCQTLFALVQQIADSLKKNKQKNSLVGTLIPGHTGMLEIMSMLIPLLA